MGNYLSHKQKFITAVDEFDYYQRIKPSAILQYFQDLATVHATMIGIGFEEMQAQNLCWILSRVSAEIVRPPVLGEEITVETFPRKPNLVDAIRDYYITDKSGQILVRGTSKWCMLDVCSRAIRRCAPLFKYDDSRYITKIAAEGGNPKIEEMSQLTQNPVKAFEGKVCITDLDRNIHMNNARYGDIILNACNIDFLNNHQIKSFDINFISELKIGEPYEVFKFTNSEKTNFEAINVSSQKVVFRAKIKWQEFNKQ